VPELIRREEQLVLAHRLWYTHLSSAFLFHLCWHAM
jgi:hypothetical protein